MRHTLLHRRLRPLLLLAMLLLLAACAVPNVAQTPIIASTEQPVRVNGSLAYTNDIFLTSAASPMTTRC